jgi:hypothetical protein
VTVSERRSTLSRSCPWCVCVVWVTSYARVPHHSPRHSTRTLPVRPGVSEEWRVLWLRRGSRTGVLGFDSREPQRRLHHMYTHPHPFLSCPCGVYPAAHDGNSKADYPYPTKSVRKNTDIRSFVDIKREGTSEVIKSNF